MASKGRDSLASFLGVIVFLAGVTVIGLALWQAWQLFSLTPRDSLGLETGKPIDFGSVLQHFGQVLIRILLLVLIAGIGSTLANRGARMYASGHRPHTPDPDE